MICHLFDMIIKRLDLIAQLKTNATTSARARARPLYVCCGNNVTIFYGDTGHIINNRFDSARRAIPFVVNNSAK
jgi:hypothetical protein